MPSTTNVLLPAKTFSMRQRLGRLAALAAAGSLILTGLAATPAMAAAGSVITKGHVVSPTGKGVAGVEVSVYYRIPSVGQYLVKRTHTSKTGRYEVKTPRSSDYYKLKVTDYGDNDRDQGDGRWASTVTAAYRSGSGVIKRDLTVHNGATLTGKIYDRTGRGAANLRVQAGGSVTSSVIYTYTRADGSYRFTNLAAGATGVYVASPTSNGNARWYVRTNSAGSVTGTDATKLQLAYGKRVNGVNIYFPSVSKIAGRVTVDGIQPHGEGGPYVTTVLYDSQGRRLVEYFTNPSFQLRDLPAGTYYLGFESPDVVSEYYADAATLATATPITVKSGGAVTGLVANLSSR